MPHTTMDCSKVCKNGKGVMSLSTGVCICDSVTSVEEVCDGRCRYQIPKVTVNQNGGYYYYDAINADPDVVETMSLSKSDKI